MAKQPSAQHPASGLDNRAGQKQLLFILLIGLALLALLGLALSQLQNANAQTANPQSLPFGNQTVGTQSGSQAATFTNNLSVPMTVTATINGADFVITNNGCNRVVSGDGGTCTVQVAFKPLTPGPKQNESVVFNFSYDDSSITPVLTGAKPSALVNNSTSTLLTGTGVAPTTAVPTTTLAATTRAASNCGSQIQGYVLIDGQPGAGIVVNLEGPANNSVTIGEGGYFYFNDLCAGNYKVSLQYDHSKYKANDADVRNFQVDGVNAYRNNAFSLSTITATTAAPTTAAPTTPVTGTTPAQTTAAPTTPAVATTVPASEPDCNLPAGTVVRVCVATTQQSANHVALVLKVLAGDSPVNLNDTVIINLPAGAIVTSATSALGAVTVTSNNTVRWGSFSLSPKQSANIVLSIDAPGGNLNGSSIFVSGSFNRSQAFQQRIPGLPGLTDIVPAAPQNSGTGGQGGGTSAPSQVPSQAPATGTGQENSQDVPAIWLILAAIVSGGLGFLGLFLTGRSKKTARKEQK